MKKIGILLLIVFFPLSVVAKTNLDIEKPYMLDASSCTSLLGSPSTSGTPAFYLDKAFSVLKYVAIILLIVMSMFDFITAVTAHDNDAIQKATSKTIKRLIYCVVIFFLPLLIRFVLEYLNDRAIDLCGIGG